MALFYVLCLLFHDPSKMNLGSIFRKIDSCVAVKLNVTNKGSPILAVSSEACNPKNK